MADKIAVPQTLAPAGKQLLRDHGFTVVELPDQKVSTLLELAPDAFGVILLTFPFPKETIHQMPNLKIIARNGVGYDNLDVPYLNQHGVFVTITPLANAGTVAETTLTSILALSKHLVPATNAMRAGEWEAARTHLGFDLAGKTVGIIGYGRIGKMVEQKMSALDMRILINSPHATTAAYGTVVDRDTLLRESDVVTLHMPIRPDTKNSIAAREFQLMKNSAVLINFARGAVVNTDDLVTALTTGAIQGAALDVFDQEPLPKSSPLYQLDNVLLTPHIASNTVECTNRMATDAASEIIRVAEGKEPQWPVH
ncbi:phosphoglycerate dehydrogenase [Fructilactobacillus myrtifloralis]|uniref:Phosphoglycerate dehydrogenase n=1 Tax=Fructilactobacillus myrtifloralis TaxID=2940301 RepID=A0ABY5BPL5_9LACO|nr:phosphoglycerate dehydrogenase [Fructilactobacillus myrtifloralis]USS85577.1 phosphoglycerate dehydrogenase [Fructilactobacillus myrtifloralis]